MSKNAREFDDGERGLTRRVETSERTSEAVLEAVDTISENRVGGSMPDDGATVPRSQDPLYETIDPDALDRLFQPTASGPRRNEGRVTFSYADCEVTVRGDGLVRVRPVDGHVVADD